MNVRRAMFVAALTLTGAAGPALAQGVPGQEPPCFKEFTRLREVAQSKAKLIEAAGRRKQKPSPQEACKLFTAFLAAESKLINYAIANETWCGIPAQAVESMKKGHAQTSSTRTRICKIAAAGPPRPRGPTLSDALSGPVPDANNIKTGRGTFDTLTGSPLGSR